VRKNAPLLAIYEEFGFSMATEPAMKIAKALLRAREDTARIEWIKSQLDRGTNIDFTRELADLDDNTTGLCVMIWQSPQAGPDEGCGSFLVGNTDFRAAIDDARKKAKNDA
jgi:hypothetical protein